MIRDAEEYEERGLASSVEAEEIRNQADTLV